MLPVGVIFLLGTFLSGYTLLNASLTTADSLMQSNVHERTHSASAQLAWAAA
jgi:hypothetical protein